jgi:hypothetical protein
MVSGDYASVRRTFYLAQLSPVRGEHAQDRGAHALRGYADSFDQPTNRTTGPQVTGDIQRNG